MPCACDQCLQHSKTLGLEPSPSSPGAFSKELIHRAYRDAAKLWHPDRFEAEPAQLPEAEAHFKQLQVAYRELSEHQQNPVVEIIFEVQPASSRTARAHAVSFAVDDAVIVSDPFAAEAKAQPQLAFGAAPGVYTAPRLPVQVEALIATHLAPGEKPLAIVDLSRTSSAGGDFSQFLLLASHAVIVRDATSQTSIIWYSDLGEIRMIDQRRRGKLGIWHRLLETVSGTQQKYALLIHRRNGALFYRLAGQTDDSVKKVIYNFLLRKKYQPHA